MVSALPVHTKGPATKLSPADSSSLLTANHLPLRGFWMIVESALEMAEAELPTLYQQAPGRHAIASSWREGMS